MSIAPFTPTSTAPAAGHKAEGHAKAGKHAPAGDATDSALGFLAELAAAVSTAALADQPTVPGSSDPGSTTSPKGDALAGTPQGAPAALAATLAGGMASMARIPAAEAPTGSTPGSPASGAASVVAPAGSTSAAVPGTAARLAKDAASALPVPTGSTSAVPVTTGSTPGQAAAATDVDPTVTAPGRASKAEPASEHAAAASSDPDATSATASVPLAAEAPDVTPNPGAVVLNPLATAAASPTTAVADQQPAQTTAVLRQVFPEVTKAATSGPGSHRIAITLHPEDLGEVRVTVVVRGNNVRVDVATDPTHGIARTALEHGAPELRKLLEATGADTRVTFREFGSSVAPTGSATDGGRQQSFAQAQAQADAQANSQGGNRSTTTSYPSGEQATRPSSTASANAPEDLSTPSVRSAASGVDQLI